jgi:Uma2 family endonuclease
MIEKLRRVAPGDRMTVAEFFAVAPEDRKAELIDGVLVMPTPASTSHERLQRFLLTVLHIFVSCRRLGEVLGSRTAVDLGIEYQVYEPDILFVAAERTYLIQEQGVMGVPDLVVEILSPSTQALDRSVKRHTYAQAGVRELWLVDPEDEAGSRFYQRHDPAGPLVEVVFEGGILHSLAVPGFYLKAEWLWPESGQLPDEVEVLRELGVL